MKTWKEYAKLKGWNLNEATPDLKLSPPAEAAKTKIMASNPDAVPGGTDAKVLKDIQKDKTVTKLDPKDQAALGTAFSGKESDVMAAMKKKMGKKMKKS